MTYCFRYLIVLFSVISVNEVFAAQKTAAPIYQEAELPPVKRIVLYNSGVGQFQHEGEIEGDVGIGMKFDSHDISDVLKSIAISDFGGGSIRSIEYQTAPDPEDIAADEIGATMTLAQFLQSLRGEKLILSKDDQSITGKIYGVESRAKDGMVREVLVLLTDAGLSSHELDEFDAVKFADPKLNEKLSLALRGVVKSRKTMQRELQLLFAGEKKRLVKFAYVIDVPIWRMTYRLLLEEDKAFLQGWAHVDNVSGVDWDRVDLELRSGKPKTFHANIFAPVMAKRVDIGTSAYEYLDGLSVATNWFGLPPTPRFNLSRKFQSANGSDPIVGLGGGGLGGGGLGGGSFGRSIPGERDGGDGVDVREGFKSNFKTEKVSQMVVYRISDPVSLGTGKSAAIPAFGVELPGKLLSIADLYDENGSVTPMRSVELDNNTSFSLLSGPLSIMQNGDFVGDGLLPRIDVNQNAYINFGVDRPLRVTELPSRTVKELVKVELVGKTLKYSYEKSRIQRFEIVNVDDENRDVLIKTGRESTNEKTIEPEPYRKTDDRLSFKVTAKAGQALNLKVTYRSTSQSAFSVSKYRIGDRKSWEQVEEFLSKEGLAMLRSVSSVNQKIDRQREVVIQLRQQRKKAELEQNRLRENLAVFPPGAEEARRMLAKFQKTEERIDEIELQIDAASKASESLEAKKAELLD